jgi:hypothetical protein
MRQHDFGVPTLSPALLGGFPSATSVVRTRYRAFASESLTTEYIPILRAPLAAAYARASKGEGDGLQTGGGRKSGH